MERPVIAHYQDHVTYISDMIRFRKETQRHFSVAKGCRGLRRVSPSLVTLILKRERRLTVDRVDAFAKLLDLSPGEKQFLKDWILRLEGGIPETPVPKEEGKRRRVSGQHLLKDWINVYVKDAFALSSVRNKPSTIYRILAGIANQKRIDRAIEFLLREGFLKRTPEGSLVEDVPLHVVDNKIPDSKVRQFHKGALRTAMQALDQYPITERFASACTVPLDESSYQELQEMIESFNQKVQDFAEGRKDGDGLYQIVIHLSPTGGKNVDDD